MFDQFKLYLYAAAGAVVAIFIAIFKYRGAKIDDLEEDIEVMVHNDKVKDKVRDNEIKVSDYEADNRVAAVKAGQPSDYALNHTDNPEGKFYDI